jgi:hypothetical protein
VCASHVHRKKKAHTYEQQQGMLNCTNGEDTCMQNSRINKDRGNYCATHIRTTARHAQLYKWRRHLHAKLKN